MNVAQWKNAIHGKSSKNEKNGKMEKISKWGKKSQNIKRIPNGWKNVKIEKECPTDGKNFISPFFIELKSPIGHFLSHADLNFCRLQGWKMTKCRSVYFHHTFSR
jgi:hypothetical protein